MEWLEKIIRRRQRAVRAGREDELAGGEVVETEEEELMIGEEEPETRPAPAGEGRRLQAPAAKKLRRRLPEKAQESQAEEKGCEEEGGSGRRLEKKGREE